MEKHTDDINVSVFSSQEEANGHCSEEFNETSKNYGEFTAIFSMIHEKIANMPNCKYLNADAKHCIATHIAYDICDNILDKLEPLTKDDAIRFLVNQIDEERINLIIEAENI